MSATAHPQKNKTKLPSKIADRAAHTRIQNKDQSEQYYKIRMEGEYMKERMNMLTTISVMYAMFFSQTLKVAYIHVHCDGHSLIQCYKKLL